MNIDISLAILFIIIVLSTAQFVLIYSIKKPVTINHLLALNTKSHTIQIICIIVTLIYFGILFIILQQFTLPQPDPNLQPFTKYLYENTNIPPNIFYRQLDHEEFTTQETFSFLYTSTDVSQKQVEKTGKYLQKRLCKKKCIINFYDNIHAYLLDKYRTTITDDSVMYQWNKQNYIFVADHFIGYLPSRPNQPFVYYPYKDAYYQNHLQ